MGSTIEFRQPGPLGQVTFDSYTIIVLGFRVANDARDKAAAALDAASMKLTTAFPWLAGQVVIEGRTESKSGKYAIVPYPEQEGKSLVRTKDCTELCPSYDEILAAKAPFSMLDGDILVSTSPMGYNMPQSVPWPILVIEANYIDGGLLLAFSTQHTGADMTGQGRIITYFAQALRHESFDPEDVREGNRTPDTVKFITKDEQAHSLAGLHRPSQLQVKYPTPVPPKAAMPWVYYRVSAANAKHLKSLSKAYSTNDAITAFYVQTHTNVRAAAGVLKGDEAVVLQRAMSIREQCGYSDRYLGSTAGSPSTTLYPNTDLVTVAAQLRKDLKNIDTHYARSFATALALDDDSTKYYYGADNRMGKDLVVSSWAKLPLCNTSFGEEMGGYPGFVRRPNLAPAPVTYILPLTRDGDVDLAICTTPDDHKLLQEDKEWCKYAEYIG
ncbi:Trichothecene 3-O-acetyltransferase [Cyphellophora attinorum]|uniref:Trichothecene 3-O-acetyltransferase n=1 Tax=Cyphellophora attinorum TaxID=1664694 RepID=A0A0N0NK32_9EURO|nr:Trichothecene 3-O-acetyltransferase [Phialophora attinorum]KPI37349.1 Trichothecene 3-O-acetyltransferase [Phialophora attinorum]